MATSFELGTDGPSVLVAPVDGSPTSLRAAAYAGGLARRQRSRLVVVYVTRPVGVPALAPDAAAGLAEAADAVGEELRAQVGPARDRLGIEIELVTRHGDPFVEICAVCEQVRADAVVVGASASRGHRWVGSLAVRLVRTGRWPVTVVP